MQPRVLINHERRILIEVSRTKTKVRCITPERDVRNLPLAGFDKTWHPLEKHTVMHVALRWLESHNQHTKPLTERAKKELIMVLATTAENTFIAKFNSLDEAVQSCKTGDLVFASIQEMIDSLTGKELAVLFTSVTGKEVTGGRVTDRKRAAQMIWETVEGMKAPDKLIIPTKKTVKVSRNILTPEERHPATNALLTQLRSGGTRSEVLSGAEMLYSGKTEPTAALKAAFAYIYPALQLLNLLEVTPDNHIKLKG